MSSYVKCVQQYCYSGRERPKHVGSLPILYIIVSNYIAVTCLSARNMANYKLQPP